MVEAIRNIVIFAISFSIGSRVFTYVYRKYKGYQYKILFPTIGFIIYSLLIVLIVKEYMISMIIGYLVALARVALGMTENI